jgi:hypothetical protein
MKLPPSGFGPGWDIGTLVIVPLAQALPEVGSFAKGNLRGFSACRASLDTPQPARG